MPDIGIATIEVCLKALDDLPHEDAMAAIGYITQRLNIKESRRRIVEQQKAKLGREPTEDETRNALDEWDVEVADKSATATYSPGALGLGGPTPAAYMKRAI
jgi:hypothetical protein